VHIVSTQQQVLRVKSPLGLQEAAVDFAEILDALRCQLLPQWDLEVESCNDGSRVSGIICLIIV